MKRCLLFILMLAGVASASGQTMRLELTIRDSKTQVAFFCHDTIYIDPVNRISGVLCWAVDAFALHSVKDAKTRSYYDARSQNICKELVEGTYDPVSRKLKFHGIRGGSDPGKILSNNDYELSLTTIQVATRRGQPHAADGFAGTIRSRDKKHNYDIVSSAYQFLSVSYFETSHGQEIQRSVQEGAKRRAQLQAQLQTNDGRVATQNTAANDWYAKGKEMLKKSSEIAQEATENTEQECFARALTYASKGVECFSEAIKLDPGNIPAHFQRGVCYYHCLAVHSSDNNFENKAIEDFKWCIAHDDDAKYKGLYCESIGLTYKTAGQYQQGIYYFTEAIKLDPKSASGFRDRGECQYNLGNYTQALDDYNTALTLDPNIDDIQKDIQEAKAVINNR